MLPTGGNMKKLRKANSVVNNVMAPGGGRKAGPAELEYQQPGVDPHQRAKVNFLRRQVGNQQTPSSLTAPEGAKYPVERDYTMERLRSAGYRWYDHYDPAVGGLLMLDGANRVREDARRMKDMSLADAKEHIITHPPVEGGKIDNAFDQEDLDAQGRRAAQRQAHARKAKQGMRKIQLAQAMGIKAEVIAGKDSAPYHGPDRFSLDTDRVFDPDWQNPEEKLQELEDAPPDEDSPDLPSNGGKDLKKGARTQAFELQRMKTAETTDAVKDLDSRIDATGEYLKVHNENPGYVSKEIETYNRRRTNMELDWQDLTPTAIKKRADLEESMAYKNAVDEALARRRVHDRRSGYMDSRKSSSVVFDEGGKMIAADTVEELEEQKKEWLSTKYEKIQKAPVAWTLSLVADDLDAAEAEEVALQKFRDRPASAPAPTRDNRPPVDPREKWMDERMKGNGAYLKRLSSAITTLPDGKQQVGPVKPRKKGRSLDEAHELLTDIAEAQYDARNVRLIAGEFRREEEERLMEIARRDGSPVNAAGLPLLLQDAPAADAMEQQLVVRQQLEDEQIVHDSDHDVTRGGIITEVVLPPQHNMELPRQVISSRSQSQSPSKTRSHPSRPTTAPPAFLAYAREARAALCARSYDLLAHRPELQKTYRRSPPRQRSPPRTDRPKSSTRPGKRRPQSAVHVSSPTKDDPAPAEEGTAGDSSSTSPRNKRRAISAGTARDRAQGAVATDVAHNRPPPRSGEPDSDATSEHTTFVEQSTLLVVGNKKRKKRPMSSTLPVAPEDRVLSPCGVGDLVFVRRRSPSPQTRKSTSKEEQYDIESLQRDFDEYVYDDEEVHLQAEASRDYNNPNSRVTSRPTSSTTARPASSNARPESATQLGLSTARQNQVEIFLPLPCNRAPERKSVGDQIKEMLAMHNDKDGAAVPGGRAPRNRREKPPNLVRPPDFSPRAHQVAHTSGGSLMKKFNMRDIEPELYSKLLFRGLAQQKTESKVAERFFDEDGTTTAASSRPASSRRPPPGAFTITKSLIKSQVAASQQIATFNRSRPASARSPSPRPAPASVRTRPQSAVLASVPKLQSDGNETSAERYQLVARTTENPGQIRVGFETAPPLPERVHASPTLDAAERKEDLVQEVANRVLSSTLAGMRGEPVTNEPWSPNLLAAAGTDTDLDDEFASVGRRTGRGRPRSPAAPAAEKINLRNGSELHEIVANAGTSASDDEDKAELVQDVADRVLSKSIAENIEREAQAKTPAPLSPPSARREELSGTALAVVSKRPQSARPHGGSRTHSLTAATRHDTRAAPEEPEEEADEDDEFAYDLDGDDALFGNEFDAHLGGGAAALRSFFKSGGAQKFCPDEVKVSEVRQMRRELRARRGGFTALLMPNADEEAMRKVTKKGEEKDVNYAKREMFWHEKLAAARVRAARHQVKVSKGMSIKIDRHKAPAQSAPLSPFSAGSPMRSPSRPQSATSQARGALLKTSSSSRPSTAPRTRPGSAASSALPPIKKVKRDIAYDFLNSMERQPLQGQLKDTISTLLSTIHESGKQNEDDANEGGNVAETDKKSTPAGTAGPHRRPASAAHLRRMEQQRKRKQRPQEWFYAHTVVACINENCCRGQRYYFDEPKERLDHIVMGRTSKHYYGYLEKKEKLRWDKPDLD
ncbi:unnamed protein product [Amoebophrya sp. A120]|nr:unnamed protein product [Amoebophrya sp. A120]|eukprot:GSA120T00021702001.1